MKINGQKDSLKTKLDVQIVETKDKSSHAPVELFICNRNVETSEKDFKLAAKDIIKIDLKQKRKQGLHMEVLKSK